MGLKDLLDSVIGFEPQLYIEDTLGNVIRLFDMKYAACVIFLFLMIYFIYSIVLNLIRIIGGAVNGK